MALSLRRQRAAAAPHEAGAPARVDRRTKNLTKRLQPGDIAVIDHADLDRVSAEALVKCKPAAVINAALSTTGRYPNLGPEILLGADVPLIDEAGSQLMDEITEGERLSVRGNELLRGDEVIATGIEMTPERLERLMAEARAGLSDQLEAFAQNTMEYLRKERDLLLDGVGIPQITTDIEGRHVLIVVRGYHYREDIRALRPYIREYKPLLVGVDGGADALIEAGYTPDLIVGDMDSVTDEALRCGAEIVVHAYRDGRAPGLKRVEDLGLTPVVFPAAGTSEDVAMLLADDCGAQLIVAIGTHVTLVEFLDKGRNGQASTFLTRLRVGGKLVDAKGVSRLYASRVPWGLVAAMIICGLVALGAALLATPAGQAFLEVVGARWDDFWAWLGRIFT